MKSLGLLSLFKSNEDINPQVCNGMALDLLIGSIVSPCNATCGASGYSRAKCMKNIEENIEEIACAELIERIDGVSRAFQQISTISVLLDPHERQATVSTSETTN